jgi:ubiquitin carboxyl-terminal hydrolase 1
MDFGNQQAKSEALHRVFGLNDNSLATVMQRARRLSGLDKVLRPFNLAPAGLGNWDNSCYQNSIIQSLASLPSFDEFLADNVEGISLCDARSTHDALRDIIGRLNHLENEGKRLWTPSVLKSMNSWQQQDAQEYFSRIIDEVDREVSKYARQQTTDLGFRRAADDAKPSRAWQPNPFQGLLAQRVGCTRCGYAEGLSLLPFTCLTVNLGTQREYDVRDCLDEYTALESIEGVECIKCTILRTKASLQHVLDNINASDASKPAVEADSAPVSTLRNTVTERLQVINEVCDAGDFSDSGLYKKCTISAKSRVSSTKSKQAIIARAPDDLVIHVNRSIFDMTGFQRKNHARVRFPLNLNLSNWCLGSDCEKAEQETVERWNISPNESMLPHVGAEQLETGKLYKLRSVITHYGGHENGHYIAYRKRPSQLEGADISAAAAKKPGEKWYCYSDDVVSPVSEDHVLSQGGVFMLFYEAAPGTENMPTITTLPVVNESALTAEQISPGALTAKADGGVYDGETVKADGTGLGSTQSAVDMVTHAEVESPLRSSPSTEPTVRLEDQPEHSKPPVQPESAKSSAVAPIMRTAGALSPNSGIGRRSSNISIHSPSFVAAS